MRVKKFVLAISVVTILFGSIALSSVFGLWNTQSSKIPVKFKNGEFAGEYNPSDIRGSYTFENISSLFKISLNDLATAFAVPEDQPKAEFLCKYLEELYAESAEQGKEVGTHSVKVFVALYKGLPIDLDDDTYFPKSAEQILLNNAILNDEQITYIQSHLVEPIQVSEVNETSNNEQNNEEKAVSGKTTFKEIIAKGVDIKEIEKIIENNLSDENQTIRDYCIANELQFSEVKSELEQLIKDE